MVSWKGFSLGTASKLIRKFPIVKTHCSLRFVVNTVLLLCEWASGNRRHIQRGRKCRWAAVYPSEWLIRKQIVNLQRLLFYRRPFEYWIFISMLRITMDKQLKKSPLYTTGCCTAATNHTCLFRYTNKAINVAHSFGCWSCCLLFPSFRSRMKVQCSWTKYATT